MIDKSDKFNKDWSKYKKEFLATANLDYEQQQEQFKEWKADMVDRVDKKNRREYGQIWDSWLLEYDPVKLEVLQNKFPIIVRYSTDETLDCMDFTAVETLQKEIQKLSYPTSKRGLDWLEGVVRDNGMSIINRDDEANELAEIFLEHIAIEVGQESILAEELEQYIFDDSSSLSKLFKATILPVCSSLARLVPQQFIYEIEEYEKLDEYPFTKMNLKEVPIDDPEPTQRYHRNDFKQQFKIALNVTRENTVVEKLSGDSEKKRIPRPNLKDVKEYNKAMFDDDSVEDLIQQLEDRWEMLIETRPTIVGRRKEIISKMKHLLENVGTDKDIIKNFVDYISKDHKIFLLNQYN